MSYGPIEPLGAHTVQVSSATRPGYFRGERLAPYWRRVGAGFIDYFLVAGWAVPWFFARFLGYGWFDAWALVGLFANSCLWQGTTGQSLGKKVFEIQLISSYLDESTGAIHPGVPGVGMCVWRQVLHIWDTMILCIGWLAPLWNPWKQTGADDKAGTICIVLPSKVTVFESPTGRRLRGQDI